MDKTIDDLFILKLIKAGDRLAFKHLFELYFTPLCRFVHLYMKKPGAAEDIVVDIFASFWERRETLQIQITLKAYLFQSARNRALNYLRDNERFISTDDFSSLERFENDETVCNHLVGISSCKLVKKDNELWCSLFFLGCFVPVS